MVAFYDPRAEAVAGTSNAAASAGEHMRTIITATALVLALAGPPFAVPQTPIGRFEGTVRGSLASRPVSAAQVSLVRLDSDTSATYSIRVDARGRFHADSLPAGRY